MNWININIINLRLTSLSLLCFMLSCTTQRNTSIKASITINTDVKAKPYNPMIFGGFLEHFGKQIYGGVFDPGSPLSDDKGFRTDVIEALNELDTEKVEPLTSVADIKLRLREDKFEANNIRDKILKNSPDENKDYFVVPKVVE